jgi:RNA polymerase sigma-70 factor (ECF subfamily)
MTAPDYADDDVLVAALRARDEDAFAWLLDRYSGLLRRLARAYVSSDAAADEVVSEAWLAVITGIDRFEQRSSLKTWIHRIVMNIARTKGAREHRSVPFSSLAAEADTPETAVDPARFQPKGTPGAGGWASPPVPWDEEPETRLSASETLAVVRAAIAGLPPGQQMVITLRDLEGWRAAEVCNALDLTETNQRVLLHRARAKVRTALEDHFEEPVR